MLGELNSFCAQQQQQLAASNLDFLVPPPNHQRPAAAAAAAAAVRSSSQVILNTSAEPQNDIRRQLQQILNSNDGVNAILVHEREVNTANNKLRHQIEVLKEMNEDMQVSNERAFQDTQDADRQIWYLRVAIGFLSLVLCVTIAAAADACHCCAIKTAQAEAAVNNIKNSVCAAPSPQNKQKSMFDASDFPSNAKNYLTFH